MLGCVQGHPWPCALQAAGWTHPRVGPRIGLASVSEPKTALVISFLKTLAHMELFVPIFI